MNLRKEVGKAQQCKFQNKVVEQKSEKWHNKVSESHIEQQNYSYPKISEGVQPGFIVNAQICFQIGEE